MKFILEIDDKELIQENIDLSGNTECPTSYDLKMNVEGNLCNYYSDFTLYADGDIVYGLEENDNE